MLNRQQAPTKRPRRPNPTPLVTSPRCPRTRAAIQARDPFPGKSPWGAGVGGRIAESRHPAAADVMPKTTARSAAWACSRVPSLSCIQQRCRYTLSTTAGAGHVYLL
ncbi:hypothetical protein MRX96_025000 [Rhipicephalus microplus]